MTPLLRPRAVEEQGDGGTQAGIGWEMWVRMDKIMCAVLREAHERLMEETMDTLEDGPQRFYKSHLDD